MAGLSDLLSTLQQNRDAAYNSIGTDQQNTVGAAVGALTDIFLPTDLIYTINKASRGEEVTGDDITMSVLDGAATALGLVTFGAGKAIGSGVKLALKSGKIAAGSAGVGVSILSDTDTDTDGSGDTDNHQPQTPTPEEKKTPAAQPTGTDTDGLQELMLAYMLLSDSNNKQTTPTVIYQPTQEKTNFTPFLLGGFALIVVVLLVVIVSRNK